MSFLLQLDTVIAIFPPDPLVLAHYHQHLGQIFVVPPGSAEPWRT